MEKSQGGHVFYGHVDSCCLLAGHFKLTVLALFVMLLRPPWQRRILAQVCVFQMFVIK